MILQNLTHLESYQKILLNTPQLVFLVPSELFSREKVSNYGENKILGAIISNWKSLLCFLPNAPVCSCSELGNTSHCRSSCIALRYEIIHKHIWWKSLSLFIVITEAIARTEQQLNRHGDICTKYKFFISLCLYIFCNNISNAVFYYKILAKMWSFEQVQNILSMSPPVLPHFPSQFYEKITSSHIRSYLF